MKIVKDIWCFEWGQPLDWEEIFEKFPLTIANRPFWRHLTNSFPRDWSCKLRIGPLPLKKGEWAGLYSEEHLALPTVVFKVPLASLQLCEDTRLSLPRPLEVTFFSVGTQSHSLHVEERITSFMQPGGGDPDHATTSQGNPHIPSGVVKRVRVLPLLKGKKESKHTTLLFYGPVADLTFDPMQYRWSDGSPLMDYSAKKGRELLNQNTLNDSPATGKWVGVLPANFRFEWKKTVRQDAGPEGIDSYLAHVEPGGCR
jgi:hypothetical protein